MDRRGFCGDVVVAEVVVVTDTCEDFKSIFLTYFFEESESGGYEVRVVAETVATSIRKIFLKHHFLNVLVRMVCSRRNCKFHAIVEHIGRLDVNTFVEPLPILFAGIQIT